MAEEFTTLYKKMKISPSITDISLPALVQERDTIILARDNIEAEETSGYTVCFHKIFILHFSDERDQAHLFQERYNSNILLDMREEEDDDIFYNA